MNEPLAGRTPSVFSLSPRIWQLEACDKQQNQGEAARAPGRVRGHHSQFLTDPPAGDSVPLWSAWRESAPSNCLTMAPSVGTANVSLCAATRTSAAGIDPESESRGLKVPGHSGSMIAFRTGPFGLVGWYLAGNDSHIRWWSAEREAATSKVGWRVSRVTNWTQIPSSSYNCVCGFHEMDIIASMGVIGRFFR